MIDINLVPPELRKKKKKSLIPGGVKIPLEMVIGMGGGVIIILVLVSIVFFMMNMQRSSVLRGMQKKWAAMQPEKQKTDGVLTILRKLQTDVKSMEGLTSAKSLTWAKKLNILSDHMPRGVWLKKIALNEDSLLIEGSAIARQQSEMIGVHTFASELRQNTDFLEGLKDIEVSSIQTRSVQKIEVADFLITTKRK